MAKTLKAFMKTEAFRHAAKHSGYSTPEDFGPDPDSSGRITRHFRGHYTLPEIDALFADTKTVQAAFDAWDGEPDPTMPTDVESTLINALRVAADEYGKHARELDETATDIHADAREKEDNARMAKQFRRQVGEVHLMIDAIGRDGLRAFVAAHVPQE